MTRPVGSSRWTIPVRLLSSVAVVGRDNEPLYLKGDLCNSSSLSMGISDERKNNEDMRDSDYAIKYDSEAIESSSSSKEGKGIIGRIKEVFGGNEETSQKCKKTSMSQSDEIDDNEEDEDPFGFYGSSLTDTMSLTQQLVMHASLDRLEEIAFRSTKGGAVNWRSPGSAGINSMWMGLLCEVEERWNVYGYHTNTGVKFMIILENMYMNEDGIHQFHASTSLANLTLSSNDSAHLCADLKVLFTRIHELFVRYTLNPFSKLRSPIKSHVFDKGIEDMSRSFNSNVLSSALSLHATPIGMDSEASLSWM